MIAAQHASLTGDALKRAAMLRRAARHSLFVRMMRRAIPFGAIGLLVMLAGAMVVARTSEKGFAGAAPPDGLGQGNLTMVSPRLTGFQKDQRSFDVRAATATQNLKRMNRVDLTAPVAKIEMAAKSFANIVARTGIYDTKLDRMLLRNRIRIVTDSGYTLLLELARIDFKSGALESVRPVVVQMESGSIRANRMNATDSGEKVVFSGGVTSTFQNLFVAPDVEPASKAKTIPNKTDPNKAPEKTVVQP
jgi:lipopolysaccharide export system protein LptC